MSDVEKLMEYEVEEGVKYLGEMKPGSEGYTAAVDDTVKLSDRLIAIKKANAEIELKKQQMEEEAKNNKIKNGIAIAGVGLSAAGLVAKIWATRTGFKFEETGSLCSSVFRRVYDDIMKLMK